MNGGLVALKAILEQLKPSERKAAEYILEHPREVIQFSVQKLAAYSGVSEATIIRLSKTMNMKGFQELKLRLAGDLSSSHPSGSYEEIKMGASADMIIQTVSNNNKQSIQDTTSVLSAEDIERAAEILSRARKIDVYGMGASAVIAQDIQQKLSRINWWCQAYADFHAQLTSAVTLTNKDVAIGISYSGQTAEIIESLKEAKRQGATIITLTKFGASPVAELGDLRLFTSSVEQSIRSGAMASRIAQLNVVDILFITIASRQPDNVIPLLDKTRLAVSRLKGI